MADSLIIGLAGGGGIAILLIILIGAFFVYKKIAKKSVEQENISMQSGIEFIELFMFLIVSKYGINMVLLKGFYYFTFFFICTTEDHGYDLADGNADTVQNIHEQNTSMFSTELQAPTEITENPYYDRDGNVGATNTSRFGVEAETVKVIDNIYYKL